MRKILLILILFASSINSLKAQCSVNYKEIVRENCEGIFLTHREIKSGVDEGLQFVLNKNTIYRIYLLNANKGIPNMQFKNEYKKMFSSYESKVNKERNFKYYEFSVNDSGTYHLKFDFGTSRDACVLFTLQFMAHMKDGE